MGQLGPHLADPLREDPCASGGQPWGRASPWRTLLAPSRFRAVSGRLAWAAAAGEKRGQGAGRASGLQSLRAAPRGRPHRLVTQQHQDLSGSFRGNLLRQVKVRLCFWGSLLRPLLFCRRGREKREWERQRRSSLGFVDFKQQTAFPRTFTC